VVLQEPCRNVDTHQKQQQQQGKTFKELLESEALRAPLKKIIRLNKQRLGIQSKLLLRANFVQ